VAFPTNIASRRKHLRASGTKRSGAHNTHNHPSGQNDPSQADELITARLKAALELIEVRLIDHIITSVGGSFSMAEHGLL
jgi:DNA repair protein RadC